MIGGVQVQVRCRFAVCHPVAPNHDVEVRQQTGLFEFVARKRGLGRSGNGTAHIVRLQRRQRVRCTGLGRNTSTDPLTIVVVPGVPESDDRKLLTQCRLQHAATVIARQTASLSI